MSSVLIFVKQRDGVINANLRAAASQTGAGVWGVDSLGDFEGTLKILRVPSSRLSAILIFRHLHGQP
jgi:hypothetical protein